MGEKGMKSIETNKWYGGDNRPTWAGSVTIKFECIPHKKYGTFARTTAVFVIIAPGATTGRASAPEPVCPQRVSSAKNVPAKYRVDVKTGVNAYNTGSVDQEKGHIMALELGGPDISENIVPQWAKWQGCGEWRRKEVEIHDLAVTGDPEDPKTPGYRLMFHAVVLYPKRLMVVSTALRRVCTPRAFKVRVTAIDKVSGQPLGHPVLNFEIVQDRNETDDLIALRALVPPEVAVEYYDDVVLTTENGKRKLKFVETGQNKRHKPPPIKSIATLDFGSYMQRSGLKFSLDANGEIADESSDEDFVAGDDDHESSDDDYDSDVH